MAPFYCTVQKIITFIFTVLYSTTSFVPVTDRNRLLGLTLSADSTLGMQQCAVQLRLFHLTAVDLSALHCTALLQEAVKHSLLFDREATGEWSPNFQTHLPS